MTDLILVHKLYVSWIYLILPSQKVDTIIIPKFQFWISVKLPQEMNRRCLSMTLSILRFSRTILKVLFFSFFNFYFYLVLLYNTVLVLPYSDMNPPRVYMQSQTWTPSHLPSHNISLGHPCAPAPSILHPASDIDWRFISYMIVYMFQCHSFRKYFLNLVYEPHPTHNVVNLFS